MAKPTYIRAPFSVLDRFRYDVINVSCQQGTQCYLFKLCEKMAYWAQTRNKVQIIQVLVILSG